MVVAIDGPAGVGKSTLARHLASRWNLFYLNTGRSYRVVTFLALEQGLLPDEPGPLTGDSARTQALSALARGLHWVFGIDSVTVNGRTFSEELHSAAVDSWVAQVSELVPVREAVNAAFRSLSRERDLVCEGRDMTSAVFPDAEVRIFLDASPEVRAQRRFEERAEGQSYEAILGAILARDTIDRKKPVGALKLTPGCILVDSSRLTISAVCEKVDSIVREHRH